MQTADPSSYQDAVLPVQQIGSSER